MDFRTFPHTEKDLLHLDGAMGEGGGQVLRSALALSILTRRPIHLTNLDEDIARRQKHQALRRLEPICEDSKIETVRLPSPGKGTLLLVQAEFENSRCCYFGLGAIGKRAEQVANEAVDALESFLSGDGALDEYLADQLLLPLLFAQGPSHFRTARVTRHLLTNAAVIQAFLPIQVQIDGAEGQPGMVTITPEDIG